MITNALKRGTSAGGGVCRAVIRQAQPLIGIALHGSAGRLRRKFHRTVTCCHQNGKGGQGGRQVDRDSRLFLESLINTPGLRGRRGRADRTGQLRVSVHDGSLALLTFGPQTRSRCSQQTPSFPDQLAIQSRGHQEQLHLCARVT